MLKFKLPKFMAKAALPMALALALAGSVSAGPGALQGQTREEPVEKTQLLADFARYWGLAAEHIAWANDTAPTVSVDKGSKLIVPARILPANAPENGIVANLAERGLYVFQDGQYKGFFPMSIGMPKKDSYHTPTGDYEIISRVKNPEWTAPESDWAKAMDKDRIAADDKKNPLGEYWFGISHPDGGYGFHENTNPDYTGDSVSHGCMRLNPEHAKRIYNEKLVVPGMSVKIMNEAVVVGKDKDGRYEVAVFPDIYSKDSDRLKKKFDKRVKEIGLSDLVDPSKRASLLKAKSGLPTPLLDTVKLKVKGEAWDSEVPAVLRKGSVIVPLALARDLGWNIKYDGKTKTASITKDGETRRFSAQPKSKALEAYRMQQSLLVPARDLLEGWAPYTWSGKDKTLEIGA